MTKLLVLLAQAQSAPAGAAPAPNAAPMMLQMLGVGLFMIAMFWFMSSSQKKREKEHAKMVSELKAGDEVLTTGGIYGTVTSVKEDRLIVRIGDSQKVEVGKGFINSVVKKTDAA